MTVQPAMTDDDLTVLQQDNAARLDAYAEAGNVVNITGPYVAALADFLLPEGDPRRREFTVRWEVQLSELLDELDSELARAVLAAPPPVPLQLLSRAQRRHQGKG